MEPPEEFHHPFQPYPIQAEFMRSLYAAIESKAVGIFESPTGTGKSLSLICGALTWLRDHKRWVLENGEDEVENKGNEPSWVLEYERQERRKATEVRKREMEERIARLREKERREKLAAKKLNGRVVKKRKEESTVDDESDFLLNEYYSDDEGDKDRPSEPPAGSSNISPEVLQMLQQMAPQPSLEKEEEPDEIKIFYASRTHSQLSQFVGELGRPHFPPTYRDAIKSKDEMVKHIPLASRKQLCIKPALSRLSSQTAINERCLELQKKSSKQRCEFKLNLHDSGDIVRQHDFRDHALAELRDIEDLAKLGKEMGICPYYASRQAIKPAEIVTLPYPLLLQQSTRESLGLDLTGHIVIIDEAHNLIDAISALHSTTLTQSQITRGIAQLEIYLGKFTGRLSGRNKMFIKQILALLRRLDSFLTAKKSSSGQVTAAELLLFADSGSGGLDQINFYKVEKYLRTSGLARKVEDYRTFSTNSKDRENVGTATVASTPVLMVLQSFLVALNNPRREGRIFYQSHGSEGMQFRYLLLDVSLVFADLVKSARAVILAGGTMSPLQSYITALLPDVPQDKLRIHSFPHIIPQENLLVSTLGRGPSGREMVFDFTRREDGAVIEELGRTIVGLAGLVREGGVVVFVPSYVYLDRLFKAWEHTILPKLHGKRKIFRETQTGNVDDIIREYSTAIQESSTALLFSVISGKLSEGINFSDSLCRLVLLVGIPYPNPHTPESKARQAYLQDTLRERFSMSAEDARKKALEVGEDSALRAVNQAVGRAIRHRGDWAGIVLVDERWGGERVRGKLSGWIRDNVAVSSGFGEVVGKIGTFFRSKWVN